MEILADKYIIGLYQELEDEVIADIARRVAITKRYTETAELMAKSMVEQGYSAAEIQAKVMKYLNANKEFRDAVAENTKAYKQEIQDIIDETVEKAMAAGDALIAAAGNMAWNNDLSMWEEHGADLTKPNAMSAAIAAMQKQTRGQLKNLTRSMGFKNTALGTTGVLDAYQKELDRALLKITTGVFSYDTAVNDCVKRLAESGLRSIDYASGRSYQLDTAARMCARTGMSQLAGRITEMNLQQTGQDLVITSQHMGSRPEHATWQNKVFSYSGRNKKYPDFVKETGYGTVEGLKGANCAHDFYPFWEGDVIPKDLTEPAPKKINGKEYTYYQCNQQMRKMERGIRATKREIEAQHAIGGDVTGLKAKLTAQRKAYYDFAAAADIRPKDNRLRIVAGSSDTKKTKAMRYYKSLVKSGSDDIIKLGRKEAVIGNNQFRITKSKFLKADYDDIKELKHSLSDLHVRMWYKAKDKEIVNLIDASLPLEDQAKQACELRNTYRTQARDLMKDQEKRKELDRDHPNLDFETLVKKKMDNKGLTRDDALKDIIKTSGKTNKKVDKSLGLEHSCNSEITPIE